MFVSFARGIYLFHAKLTSKDSCVKIFKLYAYVCILHFCDNEKHISLYLSYMYYENV